ncbi:MAG: hypothetical protein RMJ36_06155, partial [Candidatus Calescibacterium sp.]|nr:hypothetical protein [Candidatus Calescibacterium sp.]MDW8133219.1 hypothetical protein [Candidatus Calescibacterium sp.]
KKFNGKAIIDITEEINIYSKKNDILLFDGTNLIDFDQFIKENPIYDITQPKTKILRIYIEVDN